ncbi:MAG: AMP-binding protein, partial [Chloroflexota bacterium]|nr:AMP-binding protein [Chloroflexota bacterium]
MSGLNFWDIAGADPSRVAVVDVDERKIAAGELLASCNRLVHGLRALGLQPGDAIAAVLPNSLEVYELHLAIQQAGWYLIPINFHQVGPEIAYIVQDCEAKVLVAHERFGDACTAAVEELDFPRDRCFGVGRIPGFRRYEELGAGQPAQLPSNRTLGRTMHYTSGTTGRPKGVRRPLSEAAPDRSDFVTPLLAYGVKADETHVHLLACPWYHTAPLVMSIPSLHLGHTLVLMDKWQPERTLELIQRYRVSITHLVPTQFVRLLALPEETRRQYDVSSLRHVIHGAAPCPPEVKRSMIDWWGPVLDEYYASTEGAGTIVFSTDWLNKPGTVGRPRSADEIVIMDDDGQRLPAGHVGTVYLKPATGDFEYFKDKEKTADSHRGSYFTVGDMGYFDEDGYLYLCDRKIDMIISGGVNIYPAEIEHVLINHPEVADVAVFGIP